MNTAYVIFRPGSVYRAEAFEAGLKACGYAVQFKPPATLKQGDLLVIWNRYWESHTLAERAEKLGVPVLVAENAYIWEGGISPHDLKERPAFALARGYHNDSTVVPVASPERWERLGIELKPWRSDGDHILVCPNRTFGTPGRVMPPDWPNDVKSRLEKATGRPVRIREHPRNDPPKKPLAEDLEGAWACAIWASSAGVHSLVAGVPVICEAPYWIAKEATFDVEPYPDLGLSARRAAALHRLAHAQYSLAEIASGEAFRAVLQ